MSTTLQPLPATSQIQVIPLKNILSNEEQPRKHFCEEELQGLADSIKQNGLIQPIIVHPHPTDPGLYVIIAGERRYRAHSLLGKATIECIVKNPSEEQAEVASLIENLQRVDLNYVETAGYISKMLETRSIDFVAKQIGKSSDWVRRADAVHRKLPELGKQMLERGEISTDVAIQIARLAVKENRIQALSRITHDRLKNREAINLLRAEYKTNLLLAPFPINNAKLLPNTPSCIKCPLRVGNCRHMYSLEGDLEISDDTCTNPKCYVQKSNAEWQRRCDRARALGMTILTPEESKREWLPGKSQLKKSSLYVDLDAACEYMGGGVIWRNLLGSSETDSLRKYLSRSLINTCHTLVKRDELLYSLVKSGSPFASKINQKVQRQAELSRREKINGEADVYIKELITRRLSASLSGERLTRFVLSAIAAQLPIMTVQPALKRAGINLGDALQTAKAISEAPLKCVEEAMKSLAISIHNLPSSPAIKACGEYYGLDLGKMIDDARGMVRNRIKYNTKLSRN